MRKFNFLSLVVMATFVASDAFANVLEGWQQFTFGMTQNMVINASNGNPTGQTYPNELEEWVKIGDHSGLVTFYFSGTIPKLFEIDIDIKNFKLLGCSNADNEYYSSQLITKYGKYDHHDVDDETGIPIDIYIWKFDNGYQITLTETSAGCPHIGFDPTPTPEPTEGF